MKSFTGEECDRFSLLLLHHSPFRFCRAFPSALLSNIQVDLGIEKYQQQKGYHADHNESERIEIDGVHGIGAKFGDIQTNLVLGGIINIVIFNESSVPQWVPNMLNFEELGDVENYADDSHWYHVFKYSPLEGARIVHCLRRKKCFLEQS